MSKYHKGEFQLEVSLLHQHNHAIRAADAGRYHDVSADTKRQFTELFDEDFAPSAAYSAFKNMVYWAISESVVIIASCLIIRGCLISGRFICLLFIL